MKKEETMKKGGTKRKIDIKKRETKEQRAVACVRRRRTVFKLSANLCRLTGANIAVFVTSPSESSDVVYSFSGYSSASEIADCYLNDKLPSPKISDKLGFWWEDPDLYRNYDDVSDLNIMEDRLARIKKDIVACLDKKEKQVVSFDRDEYEPCSQAMITLGEDYDDQSFWDNDFFDLNKVSGPWKWDNNQKWDYNPRLSFKMEKLLQPQTQRDHEEKLERHVASGRAENYSRAATKPRRFPLYKRCRRAPRHPG